MAVTVDWANGEILVPKDYTTLVQSSPVEVRSLNTNQFRYDLRILEESEDGRVFPITHNHNADVQVGTITLADVLIIRAPYTVTFEDGDYVVELEGTNNNISVRNNKNSVSLSTGNTAGLIITEGSGITEQDKQDIAVLVWEILEGSEDVKAILVDARKKAKLAANKLI